ncbi:MAG: hypothetical protein ACK2UY_07300 [Anaerolineae bacterium]|jgi:hypothetical protein
MASPSIGTLNEGALHAALKDWYARPGDRLEVEVDGYFVDLVRGDLLIEIQTGSFAKIKPKLRTLTEAHRLRLVYPVAREKWIVKLDGPGGRRLSRRKSPKRGQVADVFAELVSFPRLITRPNFSLDVLLIQEEEERIHVPGKAWRRRGWVTHERRLLEVVGRHTFETGPDLAGLLPAWLPGEFTTADLAAALPCSRRLAQRMAYCLRHAGLLAPVGKRGRAIVYARSE